MTRLLSRDELRSIFPNTTNALTWLVPAMEKAEANKGKRSFLGGSKEETAVIKVSEHLQTTLQAMYVDGVIETGMSGEQIRLNLLEALALFANAYPGWPLAYEWGSKNIAQRTHPTLLQIILLFSNKLAITPAAEDGGKKIGNNDVQERDSAMIPAKIARRLLARRIAEDPQARAEGFNQQMVDRLSDLEMSGLPESTIATIVSSIADMRQSGIDTKDAILRIEQHRSQIGAGALPDPINIENYIRYRITIEYPGISVEESHIVFCIDSAMHYFKLVEQDDISNATQYADNQFFTKYTGKLLNALENVLDGGDLHDASYDFLESEISNWKSRKDEMKRINQLAGSKQQDPIPQIRKTFDARKQECA